MSQPAKFTTQLDFPHTTGNTTVPNAWICDFDALFAIGLLVIALSFVAEDPETATLDKVLACVPDDEQAEVPVTLARLVQLGYLLETPGGYEIVHPTDRLGPL